MKFFKIILFFLPIISFSQTRRIVCWSEESKLKFTDFQIVNKDSLASEDSSYAAISALQIRSFRLNNFIAVFDTYKSWMLDSVFKDNSENKIVLNHEQRHFDIVEIFVRKIRKEVADFTKNKGYDQSVLNNIISKLGEEEYHFQNLYDSETNYGLISTKQEEWNKKIDSELKELELFKMSYDESKKVEYLLNH